MVATRGAGSADIAADSDLAVHMGVGLYTEANTSCDTDWIGTVQDDMMVASIHPDPAPHYSSSKCQLYFPSGFGMLFNPSFHALLTCKIYKTGFPGYLQLFASINTPHRDSL